MTVFGLAESQAGGGHVWGDPVRGRGPKANNAENQTIHGQESCSIILQRVVAYFQLLLISMHWQIASSHPRQFDWEIDPVFSCSEDLRPAAWGQASKPPPFGRSRALLLPLGRSNCR
jgi:hypothetical protein